MLFRSPEQSFRELVQKGARIEQVWVDEDGVRPGDPPGSAWALAVIEVPTTAGSYQPLENPDIGPALDKQGNIPASQPSEQPDNQDVVVRTSRRSAPSCGGWRGSFPSP